jgi:hypothetical protein
VHIQTANTLETDICIYQQEAAAHSRIARQRLFRLIDKDNRLGSLALHAEAVSYRQSRSAIAYRDARELSGIE